MGINNGLMMAAERLLGSGLPVEKVVYLLKLSPDQAKILRAKYE